MEVVAREASDALVNAFLGASFVELEMRPKGGDDDFPRQTSEAVVFGKKSCPLCALQGLKESGAGVPVAGDGIP